MHKVVLLAATVVAATLGIPGDAQSVNAARTTQAPGGAACQLSIPTIDTGVRPKATGFRNEGTTNAVAICGIENPARDGAKAATIAFYSLDNVAHDMSCTAVNGWPDSGSLIYSTKNVTPASSSSGTMLQFLPTDFGGPGPYMPQEGLISVTCSLPPNVSVGYLSLDYDEDVGS